MVRRRARKQAAALAPNRLLTRAVPIGSTDNDSGRKDFNRE